MAYTYKNPYDKLYHDDMYRGRFVIEDDTPIIGGVSYGEHPGEAIVVNPDGARWLYDKWYAESVARASLRGTVQRDRVLSAAYDTVDERMAYDHSIVNNIVQERHGKKIGLDRFMHAGGGVCRHQALAVAMLLELHKSEGHIRGTPRVNRNIRRDELGNGSGHAWARYTTHGGTTYILDVAQQYTGTLQASLLRTALGYWDYRNNSDYPYRLR